MSVSYMAATHCQILPEWGFSGPALAPYLKTCQQCKEADRESTTSTHCELSKFRVTLTSIVYLYLECIIFGFYFCLY